MSDVLNEGHANVPPDLGARTDTSFLTDITRTRKHLVSLFDINKFVGAGGE